ncbi:MAG TPA: hypothetical protein VHE55_16915 [Fimbriimonadaceae bacterium]|nr:hypothetical protein [Fimbriimonadaceae bacterium]
MAGVRSILVPSRFNSVVTEASAEALLNLSGHVRETLDNGQEPKRIVKGLEEVGWPPAFAEWYVRMAAGSPDVLDLSPTVDAHWAKLWPIGDDILSLVNAYNVIGQASSMWLLGIAILICEGQWTDATDLSFLIFFGCQLLASAMAVAACIKARRPLGWSPVVIILTALLVNGIPLGPGIAGLVLRKNLHTRLRRARIRVGFMRVDRDSVRKAVSA